MGSTLPCETSDVCFAGKSKSAPGTNSQILQAIQENSRNATLSGSSRNTGDGVVVSQAQLSKLVIFTGKLWRPGKELNIQYLSGSEWQKQQVEMYAPWWTQYANIKFKFRGPGTADVLIEFDPDGGNRSQLGTDSADEASAGRRSMNLGNIKETTLEEKRRRSILHEFGHALGVEHEQSSPIANIAWDKDVFYKETKEKYKWDAATTDANFFAVNNVTDVTTTAFDKWSIMLYSFPKNWTTNGQFADLNTSLSAQDTAYIGFCYPKDEYDAKSFNSLQLATQPLLNQKADTVAYLYKKQAFLPNLVYGLNWIDIAAGTDLRVSASIGDIKVDRFTTSLQSWGDTNLRSAGLTWLEAQRFPFLQSGEFYPENRPINQTRPSISKRVNFASAFPKTPKVVCFFTMVDLMSGYDWQTKVFPSNIDTKGFTVNVASLMDVNLLSARVMWLAHPADQPKVASGRFSTADITNRTTGQADNSAVKPFGVTFGKVPKVFLALDEINFVGAKDLTCKVGLTNVTTTGLTWSLQSWVFGSMNGAGASYFAWEDAVQT